jgi:hypothetical protein
MRLHHGARALAAIAGLAAATAPAAHASVISDSGGYPATMPHSHIAASHRDSGSPDATLIAIGAGAAILITAGAGASRAHHRRRTTTHTQISSVS